MNSATSNTQQRPRQGTGAAAVLVAKPSKVHLKMRDAQWIGHVSVDGFGHLWFSPPAPVLVEGAGSWLVPSPRAASEAPASTQTCAEVPQNGETATRAAGGIFFDAGAVIRGDREVRRSPIQPRNAPLSGVTLFDGRPPVAARLKGTLKRNARPTVILLSASGASRQIVAGWIRREGLSPQSALRHRKAITRSPLSGRRGFVALVLPPMVLLRDERSLGGEL